MCVCVCDEDEYGRCGVGKGVMDEITGFHSQHQAIKVRTHTHTHTYMHDDGDHDDDEGRRDMNDWVRGGRMDE